VADAPRPALPEEIVRFYEQAQESERLARPSNRVELERTRELLSRYLPTPPCTVLDIGGPTGVHAFWLAERGYTVHLLDAIELHIIQAKDRLARVPHPSLARVAVADARDLDYADESADAILLLGPLYHLTDEQDRAQALQEARRVLRPGGRLLAAAITRFISTINGMTEGAIADATFRSIIDRDLREGQHRSPTASPEHFTTAYFHHPDELGRELARAGLNVEALLAVEGPADLLKEPEKYWDDPLMRDWLLQIIHRVESEHCLLGLSTHIMAVASKP
jgi:ubiquinone/menaquinone biosynthesis C-methylase UbiE